jgi:hypothetical protein
MSRSARAASAVAPPAAPLIIGVRHHSPACARLVAARIHALKPAWVLIEGPADFNPRLDELALPHRLPIAIYSYASGATFQHGSWAPFAEHSPEWQALCAGRAAGAALRFIDLPAWHEAFGDTLNRYADVEGADQEARAHAYLDALAAALGVDGRDALWDRLFEDHAGLDALEASLAAHFAHLRNDDPGSLGNQAREATMADWIGWAMAQGRGPVVVVCGGYHAPALARLWPAAQARYRAADAEPATPLPPPLPTPAALAEGEPAPAGGLRHGAFLVPYTFKRLDAFTGYASGMPSPAWYQWLWTHGAEGAGQQLLQAVFQRVREKKLAASTADLMAVQLRAHGLARLRGHRAPLRSDWLDALAGTLVSDALDAPLPWTYRGPIRAGTDPVLVQAMDVLAGDQAGQLALGTPQPPLVASFQAELAAAGLQLKPQPSEHELDLLTPAGRARSRLLHRAVLLDLPGFVRKSGPEWALSGQSTERWTLSQPFSQQAALIEAGAWGPNLHDAARARLEERLRAAGRRIDALAAALDRAAFAGLAALSQTVLAELQLAVAGEAHFEALGRALGKLHMLLRHGQLLGMADAPVLRVVIEAGVDRALWLLEPPAAVAAGAVDAHLQAMVTLRQIALDVAGSHREDGDDGAAPLAIEVPRMLAVFERKAASLASAPLSRGAALGAVISLRPHVDGGAAPAAAAPAALGADVAPGTATDTSTEAAAGLALQVLDSLSPPQLGDAVSGLLALARDALLHDSHFVAGLDARVQAMDDADFVIALPALRAAFAWLPTRERGSLAEQVLVLHGAPRLTHRHLLKRSSAWDAEDVAAHRLAEQQAVDALAAWGLPL